MVGQAPKQITKNKHLFKVKIQTEIIVLDESEVEAIEHVKQLSATIIAEEVDQSVLTVQRITKQNQIPKIWRNAIPYGSNDSETTLELFELINDGF